MVFIFIWVISSILCYGMIFAWCQRGFKITNYKEDFVFSIIVSFFGGVFSLVIVFILQFIVEDNPFKHGFKFR